MVNISRIALCAIIISVLPLAAAPLTNAAKSNKATVAQTSKLTNSSTNRIKLVIMTNHTYFTDHTYLVPPKSAGWPEVQDTYRENIFKDVYSVDDESVARRFEVVFLISMPATLLLNTAILSVLKFAETGVFGGDFETTRNIYLYAGSTLMSIGIASQDYQNVKKKRAAEGLRWEILRKKF